MKNTLTELNVWEIVLVSFVKFFDTIIHLSKVRMAYKHIDEVVFHFKNSVKEPKEIKQKWKYTRELSRSSPLMWTVSWRITDKNPLSLDTIEMSKSEPKSTIKIYQLKQNYYLSSLTIHESIKEKNWICFLIFGLSLPSYERLHHQDNQIGKRLLHKLDHSPVSILSRRLCNNGQHPSQSNSFFQIFFVSRRLS